MPLMRPQSRSADLRYVPQGANGDTAASVHPDDKNPEPASYLALVNELAQLSPQQLREAAYQRPDQLLDSRLLFWLRDRERLPGLSAAEREVLARLGQELTVMREWTEEQSNRTLLPSLASSLAYSNLRRWKEETGAQVPEVAGVDVEQLYRLGEKEERKLRTSLERGDGGGGLAPRRNPTRSSIEEFTKHNKVYADLARGAMARVRSRLLGFRDDGPSAAEAVLGALLKQMGSSEERATFLPEAFTPPGLEIAPDAEPTTASADGRPTMVVTTPGDLADAARSRLAVLRAGAGGSGAVGPGPDTESLSLGTSSRPQTPPWLRKREPAASTSSNEDAATGPGKAESGHGSDSTRTSGRKIGSSSGPGGPVDGGIEAASLRAERVAGGPRSVLRSGEDEAAALEELLELIDEYDRQVFSKKTPLERMGHSPGPWM